MPYTYSGDTEDVSTADFDGLLCAGTKSILNLRLIRFLFSIVGFGCTSSVDRGGGLSDGGFDDDASTKSILDLRRIIRLLILCPVPLTGRGVEASDVDQDAFRADPVKEFKLIRRPGLDPIIIVISEHDK